MNINTFIHKYLKKLIHQHSIVLDATVGNGNDALFLCQNAKFVYGMDIQTQAILNTTYKLKNYTNFKLIKDNFINQRLYIKEKLDLIIYNLGFLPNSSFKITTKAQDFIIALNESYQLLKENAYLIVSFYFHEEGFNEYYLFLNHLKDYNLKVVTTYRDYGFNKPIVFILKKIRRDNEKD